MHMKTKGTAKKQSADAASPSRAPEPPALGAECPYPGKTIRQSAAVTEYPQDAIIGKKLDATRAIRENEAKYRALFEYAHDTILIMEDGVITDCNMKAVDMFGLSKEEIVGKSPWALSPLRQPDGADSKKKAARIIASTLSGKHELFYWKHRRRDGTVFDVEVSLTSIELSSNKLVQAVARDITERKEGEETLRKKDRELELKSRSLQEMNTALRVLLNQRETDRKELGDRIVFNVKRLVLPYLEELKRSRLRAADMICVELAQSNLNEIMSPFLERLTTKYAKLTPKEIQVANLVRNGKTTKEIADFLKVSPSAIKLHRFHIRKKLGLNSQKTALQSYLLSVAEG